AQGLVASHPQATGPIARRFVTAGGEHTGRVSLMHLNTRGQRSSFPMCFLLMTLVAGCAVTPTPLAQFPDFPKMKPALGTLVVLADITSLHYMSGDIQKLDLAESEQLGIILLDEVANGLRQKGYVVGNTIHATTGWTLRPGTSVYLIRTPEDRN